jgi:hypothetical protein
MFDGRIENLSKKLTLDEGYFLNGELYVRWIDAVEEYSARKLSFERDRLPAISGLASAFALFKAMNISQATGRRIL